MCGGKTFANISCEAAVGVDPSYLINSNIMLNKKIAFLFQMTSDVFFRTIDIRKYLNGSPDLIFLDGMHKFEYLLRDFLNAERICDRHSLIAMHDCLPLNEVMTNRCEETAKKHSIGTNYENWWTGDVWKLIPILQKYRPDLKLVALDAPPTGLLLITNLDPDSKFLDENYIDIVEEFSPTSGWNEKFPELYEMIAITETSTLLQDFNQSLYLRT